MEIKGKVHCFFEQSGTFKNEFIKLGIHAEDYDIQNNFGQTDHTDDLFKAIEDALMNHKLDKADLNYLHLLKPIEKIYLNFTHVSNNRLDIDIILISFFENLKNIIPFRLDYVCKNGNDEIIIDLSIIIYLPTFVLNLIKVKGDIKRARKIH